MKTIALLGKGLNNGTWQPVTELLTQKGFNFQILNQYTELANNQLIGILLGYDKIVPEDFISKPKNGLLLFHSSDLPEGKGWAPIYYTMSNKKNELVQTLLYAHKSVDSGNILAKAKYPLLGNEIEQEVKNYDDQMTLALINECLEDIISKLPLGQKQDANKSKWWRRRSPEDSEIGINENISGLFDKLRSLPESAPAFFNYKGRSYRIDLSLYNKSDFSDFDINKLIIEKFY